MVLSPERREGPPPITFVDIDLSEAWDTDSQYKLFIKSLKSARLYQEDLLYSGFGDASEAAKAGTVFAETEDAFTTDNDERSNPLEYALVDEEGELRDSAAIGLYDPSKLEVSEDDPNKFVVKDPSALIGIARLQ